MSPGKTGRVRGVAAPNPSETKISSHRQEAETRSDAHDTTATAHGLASGPIGRRRRWVVVVLGCPFCRGIHAHYAVGVKHAGVIRRQAGCNPRRRYSIAVLVVDHGEARNLHAVPAGQNPADWGYSFPPGTPPHLRVI